MRGAFGWTLAALALALTNLGVVRLDIGARRDQFQADARTAHRLLSQRLSQHDAMLATLVLLGGEGASAAPASRLPSVYPQVLQVVRRAAGEAWPEAAWAAIEAASRRRSQPMLAAVDAGRGQYTLLRAGEPASYALQIDLARVVPWGEGPFARDGALRLQLAYDGALLPLQDGLVRSGLGAGVTPGFVLHKVLDPPSQPFELQAQRSTGPADWPWAQLAALNGLAALGAAGALALLRQRARRRRAEALLRVARTARLNVLGELAAGLAHELNQPLTAVLASTQAARRLLDDAPLPRATLEDALDQSRTQARRAAEVVARLRRLLERPGDPSALKPVELVAAAQGAIALLRPELQRAGVRTEVEGGPLHVQADPVALEQILHNLLLNALQAMADSAHRRLILRLRAEGGQGVLSLRDTGSGLSDDVLAQLFVPFVSTRPGGLGLGLSLCDSLAQGMGGTLTAQNVSGPPGAEFRLSLPLAETA